MNAIRIRTRIESTTLSLPELSGLIGKYVEILVLEGADQDADSVRSVRFAPAADLDVERFEATFGELSRLA